MKKFIASFLIALMLARAPIAAADVPVLPAVPQLTLNEPDVGLAVSPIKKGQVAPFTGVLLSPQASATITVQASTFSQTLAIAVDKQKDDDKAECDYQTGELSSQCSTDKKILQAKVDDLVKVNKVLNDEVNKNVGQSLLSNPYLWGGTGFVGGIALTVLTVFALSKASK